MHAHTGVMSHLIGPVRGRMVARVWWWCPDHARAECERRRGSAASASVEQGSRAEQCPMRYKQDL